MRTQLFVGIAALAALTGCGLENIFGNAGHAPYDRPASRITGTLQEGVPATRLAVLDGAGNGLEPFQVTAGGGGYEIRLPSSKYAFIRIQGRGGNAQWRALVPFVGEESSTVENLDARSLTEVLLVEALLGARGKKFLQLNPAAHLGDGLTSGTRTLIRRDMDTAGTPTAQLLGMVTRVLTRVNLSAGSVDPDFFGVPEMTGWTVKTSPLGAGFLTRNPLDYDSDGIAESDSAKFDAKLAEAAQRYNPAGCADPSRVRVLFTSDFRANKLDGNCGVINRFKWAVDKPGKSMFFVGWVHQDSPVQDDKADQLLGAGTPNMVRMYDDGTNGDEVAGDGIWTVSFDLPPGLRVGYKYTWGTSGAPWTGSEEWPGNSRLLEVLDVGPIDPATGQGDNFVYRRDVFGDEATNKDRSNQNGSSDKGAITWTTDMHGCGPEVREQPFTDGNACVCGTSWHTPESVGPLTVACTGP